jgi:hypothetical protein
MNLMRFEIPEMRLKQRNVPLDDVDAALTARLLDIARGAIGEGGARVRLSRKVGLNSSHFDLESFLSLLLGYFADATADPSPKVTLVDEAPAVGEDGNTGRASRRHELLLCRGGTFSEAVARSGKSSTGGFLIRGS